MTNLGRNSSLPLLHLPHEPCTCCILVLFSLHGATGNHWCIDWQSINLQFQDVGVCSTHHPNHNLHRYHLACLCFPLCNPIGLRPLWNPRWYSNSITIERANHSRYVQGKLVDDANRKWIITLGLSLQNVCVGVCSVLLYFIQYFKGPTAPFLTDYRFLMLFTALVALGSIAALASMAESIAVGRDWVIVIAGNNSDVLAGTLLRSLTL